jgi:hypothetical protein
VPKLLSLAAVAALAVSVQASPDQLGAEMKDAVAGYMLEPGTALVRNLRRVEHAGYEQPLWCGEINGKSIFGRYVGYQGFIAYKDEQGWAVIFDTEAAYLSIRQFCD